MNLNNLSDRNKVLEEYLIYINNVKNYSQNTIKSYNSDIKHYFENTESVGEFSSYLKHLLYVKSHQSGLSYLGLLTIITLIKTK